MDTPSNNRGLKDENRAGARPLGTQEGLADAIEKAKRAAAKAGINTGAFHAIDPEEVAAAAIHAGRTSFAFELKGLSSASSVSEVEDALGELEGVDAKIVYPSSMAWVSASRTIDPMMFVDVFQRFGITATLTDSSLRRRLAWSDVEEGRYKRSRRRDRRISRFGSRVDEEERRFELARRAGFLERREDTSRKESSTAVLFTARSLMTKTRLGISALFTIPVVAISYSRELQFDNWQWALAALSIPVVFYGAWPFHRATLGGARRGMSALDSASSVAILLAWLWSLSMVLFTPVGDPEYRARPKWIAIDPTIFESGALFFDVACGMTLILLAGRLAARRARSSLQDDLLKYKPNPASTVTVVSKKRKAGGVGKEDKAIQKLNVGDDVIIPAGALVPVDGIVVGGGGILDGTALGIGSCEVKVNDRVYAGCINGSKELKVRVLQTGHRTWLAAINRWVVDANVHQNRSDAIATKAASMLVPVSFVIAATDFALWALITNNLNQAFATGLAVLGCVAPAALATSASLAMRQGIEGAARRGTLIKSGETLRNVDEVDTVIFNRVGAISRPEMSVETVTADRGENPDLVLRVAGALAMESGHPVSRALVRAAREARDASTDDSIPGWIEVTHSEVDEEGSFRGHVELPVVNSDGEEELRSVEAVLWRPRNLSDLHGRLAAAAVSGSSPLVVRWKNKDRGVITLYNGAKDDAVDAVDSLESMGLETMMLSRDTYPVARRYGDMVGVSHVLAGVQPGRKPQTVRSVRSHGANIAMVGDESVEECYRVANVGIMISAMSGPQGALALEHPAADVVMLKPDVAPIPRLFHFARRLNRRIRGNLIFAWTYNLLAIVAAVAGVLHPMIAPLLMLGSSVIIEVRSHWLRSM